MTSRTARALSWSNRCIIGDCRDSMREMIAHGVRVQMCVTSPPYWGLRDYGVAGQLGLEPTVGEYVESMVGVFRLVRELLADDGVLFLNLGDSYWDSGRGGGGSFEAERRGWRDVPCDTSGRGRRDSRTNSTIASLKPKDLIGIPWRVAFALQQPYYSGRIKKELDRVWLAAMIDAEGCLFIHRRKAGQHNGQGYYRQNDSFGPGLEVANTSLAVVERCQQITGLGSICSQSPDQNGRRKQTIYRWNLRTIECRDVVREVYPYLVAKQQQARILCGCPPSGERAVAAHLALIGLHRGLATDVDFDVPASMHEKGWYLRQDVIWSKANPMPESVTDRCTKAHEYLFLLAKSERYYFDAEAIKEPQIQNTHERFGKDGKRTGEAAKQASSPNGMVRDKAGYSTMILPNGRNKRSVWSIATSPYSEAHFATFPPALVEPCILAGSRVSDTVLDPFFGSGTTGEVAQRLGRKWIGCDLQEAYAPLQARRTAQQGLELG